MQVPAPVLRAVHSLLRQRAELQGRLDRGPRQVANHKANVDRAAAAVEFAKQTAKTTRALADRKQLDLRSSEQKIAQWKTQLNQAQSNKEYQALTEQIAAAEMARSVLQDDILEVLERIDALDADTKRAEDELAAAKAEMQRVAQSVEEAAAGLKSEIARVEGELATAEEQIPGELRSDYRRLVRQHGASAMAEADDGMCSGCGQQITLNMKSDLLLSKPVFCHGCGSLLYMPE